MHWISRAQPAPLARTRAARCCVRAGREADDVVYSTGMFGRTRVGTLLARRRRASLKLTGDPAYERAVRYGLTRLSLDDFQRSRDLRIAGLKALRDLRHERCPALRLPEPRRFATSPPAGTSCDAGPDRGAAEPGLGTAAPATATSCRRGTASTGPTLVFAGRLAPQKSLDVALRALARAARG